MAGLQRIAYNPIPQVSPSNNSTCVAYEYHVTRYSTSILLLGFADCCITVFSFFVSASPKNPCKICTKATPSAYVLAMRTMRSRNLSEGDRMHVPYLVVSDCHRIKSGPNDTSKLSTYVKERYGLIIKLNHILCQVFFSPRPRKTNKEAEFR